MKLRERERRFVEAYMGQAAGNATKAAELAGYSAKSAKVTACRLLTKANVQAAIASRVNADPMVADREERQRFLTSVIRDAKCDINARLKAVDLQAKAQGDYIERHEVSGPDGRPVAVTFVDA